MKKHLPGFFAGLLVALLAIPSLAATGTVSFSTVNLAFNGKQISAKGDNYALANGAQVPASISYVDENGGSTTYLPARRISELMGVTIGFDGTTGTVQIAGTPATPTTPPSSTTAPSTDYSKWSAEEEAAYQEFKRMWKVELRFSGKDEYSVKESDSYNLIYNGQMSKKDVFAICTSSRSNGYAQRICESLRNYGRNITLWFWMNDPSIELNQVMWYDGN